MKLKKTISLVACGFIALSSIGTNFFTCSAIDGPNYIKSMSVDINDIDGIGGKLNALCQQFNYIKGISCDPDDDAFGHEQSAYEYFFQKRSMYSELSPDCQLVLSRCIEAMYINKDNPIWHGIIDCALTVLSSHGGHCSWRAESIVNDVYIFLCDSLQKIN